MTTNTWQPPKLTSIPREIGEAIRDGADEDGWFTAISTDEVNEWVEENATEMSYGKYLTHFYIK